MKLNGIELDVLVEQQKSIQQEANAAIASELTSAQALVEKLLSETDLEEIENLSEKVMEHLTNLKKVAQVANIEYCIPWDEEYCSDDDTISTKLEEHEVVYSDAWDWQKRRDTFPQFQKLTSLIGDMEYNSKQWHSSTC